MLADMAERIRIIIDADEEVKLAVKLAATKQDVSVSEIVCALIRKHLPLEIQDAKKYLPQRGRKPGDK